MQSEILYIPDLALMLGTTEAAIRSSLQRHREMLKQGLAVNLLPPTAKARGRRVCWLRNTVQEWLKSREQPATVSVAPAKEVRRGRPRKIVG